MLVLSRRTDQGFVIKVGTEKIRMKVTRIDRRQVKIGWEAPPDVRIVRDELDRDGERG